MTTHHRISGILSAVALALGVSAAPASARPFDVSASGSVVPSAAVVAAVHGNPSSPITCGDVCSGGGYGTATPAASATSETGARLPHAGRTGPLAPSTAYNTTGAPRTVVRVVTHGSGFHWGDAGIGAGGVLALSILGIAGVMAFSHRRIRRGEAPATT